MITTLWVDADIMLNGIYYEMYANDGKHAQDANISSKLTKEDREYFENLIDKSDKEEIDEAELWETWHEKEEEIADRLEKEGYQL